MTRSLKDTLDCAAEDIRSANLATRGGDSALHSPADAYDAIGSLQELIQRAPQLARQIQAFLEREQRAGRIAHDSGGSASGDVTRAGMWLQSTADALETAAAMAGKAHEAASHLKAAERGNVS